MVTLKLGRDQARTLHEWSNYWLLVCDGYIDQPGLIENEKFFWLLLRSIIKQLRRVLERRLRGPAQTFRFNYQQSEAITVLEFCKKQPIPADQFYFINLRQHIVEVLHKQIV